MVFKVKLLSINMNHLVVSLLLLSLVTFTFSVSPSCQIKKISETIPLLSSQTQQVDLSSIIDGHNLTFSLNDTQDVFKIINPITILNSETVVETFKPTPLYILRPLQDWNGVWQQKAAVITQDQILQIRIGTSNGNKNYKFDTPVTNVVFLNKTQCFDAQFIDSEHVVIDCQQQNTTRVNFVVVANGQSKTYYLDGYENSYGKKLLKYLSPSGQTFLISLTFTETDTDGFITVYKVSKNYQVSIENRILKDSFARDSLLIFDMDVDNEGNIYISLSDGVIRFKYGHGIVYQITALQLSKPRNLVSAKINGEQLLFIKTDKEILCYNNQFRLISNFQINSNVTIIDMKVNQNCLLVKGTQIQYFYSLNTARIIQTNQYSEDYHPYLNALQQTSSLLLQVSYQKDSILSSISTGLLSISKPSQDTILKFTAVSNNQTSSQTCQIELNIKVLSSSQEIVQLKSFDQTTSAESPVEVPLKLDEYFIGSRLVYEGIPQTGVTYHNKQIEPISIPTPELNSVKFTNPDTYTTLNIDSSNYYRLTTQNHLLVVERCTIYGTQVSVNQYYSISEKSQIIKSDLAMIKISGKTSPMLAYTLSNRLNQVIVVNLDNKQTIPYSVGPNYISISDFKFTKDSLVVTSKSLSSLFVITLGQSFNAAFSIGIDYFRERSIAEVKIFKPDRIHYCGIRNTFYLINIDTILVFSISNQAISYLTSIKVPETIDVSLDWNIIVSKTNLFIVFADPINKVYNYKIYSVYEYLLVDQIDMIDQTISKPLKVTNTAYFAFISTSNNTVTTIRINSPLLQSNYYLTQLDPNQPIWFIATSLQKSTILEVRTKQTQIGVHNVYYNTPLLVVNTDNHQKQFKRGYNIKINVHGINQSNQLSTTLQVYNYQTIIQTNQQYFQKLWLPNNNNGVSQVYLDINSFIGSVVKYELKCQYCNEKDSKIRLIEPFYLQRNLVDTVTSIDYLSFGNGYVWILKDKAIQYSADNLQTSKIKNIQYQGEKFIFIDDTKALLFVKNSGQQQQFIGIQAMYEYEPFTWLTYNITKDYSIGTIQKSIYQNNFLFILDNDNTNNSSGNIKAFRTTNKPDGSFDDIVGQLIIDSSSFGLESKEVINDFEIFDIDKTSKLIICTINSGVVYGTLSFDSPLSLENPSIFNLSQNKIIQDYVLNGNTFLQINHLYSNMNKRKFTFLLTVTMGAHLQITFTFDDNNNTISEINIVNSYNKYGSQIVQNQILIAPYSTTNENLFIIPYLNVTTKIITYALYRIPQVSMNSTVSLKGGYKLLSSEIQSIFFYKSNPNFYQLILSGKIQNKQSSYLSRFIVSQRLTLQLNYNSPLTKLDKVTLVGSNDYSSGSHDIGIEFDAKIGFRWYTILLIVLGGLALIGLIFGIYIYAKNRRNDQKKISLVTEDEEV